ncbi:MAG: sigma-70 family RNA polymerase sigma factor [Bacteroidaceae bacterium]|nr:sigma-70 family RNA polymerase sigma factor [Bacteroidaceae bacterium]
MEKNKVAYEHIIRGCTRRERRAQLAFYDLFARRVHVTAYRMLDNAQEAEDVVQEILLRTLTNPVILVPDFGGMGRRLRRMTINECVDRLRKRHIDWEVLDEQKEICDEQSLDEQLVREERSELLYSAIEALPQQSRTVLQLAVIEEMSYDEIASVLHISSSGVRAHLTRAKQKLVNWFKNEKRH